MGRDARYATRAQYERWWLGLDHLTPASRAVELSHVRAYVRWLVRHGYLKSDPTARMDRPRLPQRLPRPATTSQLRQALDHADGQDQLILLLASTLGLRCIEISRLQWTDVAIDGDRITLRVHGKGDKERVLTARGSLETELRARMRLRGPVVTGARGQELNASRVSTMGNRALRRAGVPVTMHQLRHWFGTQAENATHDITAVGEAMGHSSPRVTSIYVKVNARRVREVTDAVPDPMARPDDDGLAGVMAA